MNSTPDPSLPTPRSSQRSAPSGASGARGPGSETTEDLSLYTERRQRRIRITAWVVIVALIIVGGGSTLLAVLFN
ncbi:hypothetical protein [Microbacterium sp. 22242]|uniref:hypothetical protein n=1 Tax=Microbacterium sp. 22242 TaxID=3453896 RepID=UPI003F86B61E